HAGGARGPYPLDAHRRSPLGPGFRRHRGTPAMSESEGSAEPGTRRAGKDKKKINWLAEIRGLALMLLGVLAFHTLVAKPFYIPSASMMPNLMVGDRLLVSKYPYGRRRVSASFHLVPRS